MLASVPLTLPLRVTLPRGAAAPTVTVKVRSRVLPAGTTVGLPGAGATVKLDADPLKVGVSETRSQSVPPAFWTV